MLIIFEYLLFLIGLNVIISVVFEIKHIILTLRASNNLNSYGKGSWALVTACTDGIGKGFSVTLAKQGFNIVQVGRSPEKLAATASDLKSKYGIHVRNVVKDFSLGPNNPIEFYEDLFAQTKDLDISIVVNNVGGCSGMYTFLDIPIQGLLDEIALNIFPICFISRLYLPRLSSRSQGGALINLSSLMSHMILPRYIMYCSGKAFDYVLTVVANSEVRKNKDGTKVDIQSLRPGFVYTPLTSKATGKFLEINRYECAEGSLRCLGYVSETCAHKKHVLAEFIFNAIGMASPFYWYQI